MGQIKTKTESSREYVEPKESKRVETEGGMVVTMGSGGGEGEKLVKEHGLSVMRLLLPGVSHTAW